MTIVDKVNEASEYLRSRLPRLPEIGLILGSGLGVLADEIQDPQAIAYSDIPYFPQSTVHGHAGELVCGFLMGKYVIVMKGRFHYYEGYSMETVTFPVRVMKALGVHTLIVTNAAGGVNRSFSPGDLMIIEDHLNLSFGNPLIGKNFDELGVRFPDMSMAYDKELIDLAEAVAVDMGLIVQKGVYTLMSGPTYETPAEIKMIQYLGGDAVGMSTVTEVLVAKHSGLKVLGISCISNMAAGILPQPLNHEEVIETTQRVKQQFTTYVKNILDRL